ncbi:hypothetical protein MTR_6g464890 [Medicago truncatula]|uniref:Transmembrane protein n=1 Tax=Medicago truncatula TaxID=3880 RepID=A0A072U9T8_MEDTR|nr:hypothetical protein MTR_6g464890 [Medicago truncatula]
MMNLFGCSFIYLAFLIQAFQHVHLVMNHETEQKGTRELNHTHKKKGTNKNRKSELVNRTKRPEMNIPELKMEEEENRRNKIGIPEHRKIDSDNKDVVGDQPSEKSIKM